MKNKTTILYLFFATFFTFFISFYASADHIPAISNVRVENIILTGAQVKWATDIASDSRVPFGVASGEQNYNRFAGSESDRCDGGGYVTSHCVNLTGLTVNAAYYYKVESGTSSGYDTHYGECSFNAGSGGTTSCTTGTETTYNPGHSPATHNTSTSTTPIAPSGLTAVLGNNYVSVNLKWIDNSADETYFDLFWRKTGNSSWQYFAGASTNSTYADHSSPTPGNLEYMLKACNNSGCSGESNIAPVSVPLPAKKIAGSVKRPDGSAVTDAGINVRNPSTGGSVYAETDPAGNYILYLTGGTWEVFLNKKSQESNWTYNQGTGFVTFASNDSNEEKIFDFVVTTTDAKIKGKILKPDGAAPTSGTVWVNAKDTNGTYFGASPDANGVFEISIPAGTYQISIGINDPLYAAPVLASVTITSGQVKDLGTITLIKAAKVIKGSVKFNDGAPVTDANVNAYKPEGNQGSSAQTDNFGNFNITVAGGYWNLHISPKDQNAKWSYNESSKSVIFADNTTPEEQIVNFTVVKADAVLKGKVLKPDGQALAEGRAFVNLNTGTGSSFGGQVSTDGSFNIPIPSGTYEVFIWVSVSEFNDPTVGKITIAPGETKDLGVISLLKTTKTIKGKIIRADGRAVTDAGISAFHKDTQNWIGARTDASGNYFLSVLGGSWEIGIRPESPAPDWMYAEPSTLVLFANDQTTEEKILNFTVKSADSFITGVVLRPDGTPPPNQKVFVGVRNSEGFEAGGGSVNSDGTFRIAVTSGIYNLSIHSDDPALTAPNVSSITVAFGQTLDVGTIKLTLKTDHIKGKVTDKDGIAINGVEINAWKPDGFDYATTRTDSAGSYDLLVTPGEWEMHAVPGISTAFYNPNSSERILVESGKIASVNFTLLVADAAISGTVVDSQGNVLSNLYGFVDLAKSTEFGPGGLGGPIDRGNFSFKVPSGTYLLSVFLPPESPYTAGEPQSVTLNAGSTEIIKIQVLKNSSSIVGVLRDESGAIVTGIKAHIFASSQKGSWQEAILDLSTGKYTLRVAAGTWYLGYDLDPNSGFISSHEPNIAVLVSENGTAEKDLVVRKADSIIKGQVTDPKGVPVFHAFVGISKTSFSGVSTGDSFKDPIVAGAETDASGNYRIAVPAGTYFVKTFTDPAQGFINSDEQTVVVAKGETKTVNLKLKTSDITITGKVFLDELPVSNAFVWGWSQKGGYQETFTDFTGAYRLNVTSNDTWIIAAGADQNGVFYKSGETALTLGATNIEHDISLVKFSDIPATVAKTTDAAEATAVQVSGGASVVMPANSVSTSGQVSVKVTPDTRAPSQGEVKVIGLAYDLEARDASGQLVTNFNTSVTVNIPYDETMLANLGAKENDLVLSFWDETAGTWKTLSNSIVNQTENSVTAAVDHFTRFAIVAAADITPPLAPTSMTASALGNGQIKLSWINPIKDFDHVKLYRSATSSILGLITGSDIIGESHIDTGLLDSVIYYYTIRAVDPAGNESANTDQVSALAIGTSQKTAVATSTIGKTATSTSATAKKTSLPPGQQVKLNMFRNLATGDSGEDIKTLQQLLLDEGVYPEGLITGFFGSLTKQAVIRFQEKYALEILGPAGLTNGTGFFGPGTRKKANELLSGKSSEKIEKSYVPPGQIAKTEILRNLAQGDSGEEVKILQQLLLDEGVYPEGLITGYFGDLTRQAVIRFQEKYLSEILIPAGLDFGTGFVGPGTRKKIGELLK